MRKVVSIILVVAAVLLIGVGITFSIISKQDSTPNYDDYNINAYIGPNKYNGEIGDHYKGSPDAPVQIIEYGDFQCSACAGINSRIDKLIEAMDGKMSIIYRDYLLSYHQNATAAASAAEAAGLQGYWRAYGDNLFANQSAWESASSKERGELFVQYFETVTDGKGDVDQFKEDMKSDRVKKKINFDIGIGKIVDISETPSFYLNGEKINFKETKTEEEFNNLFKEKIEAALKAAEKSSN